MLTGCASNTRTESFIPPAARPYPRPDCALPDITAALANVGLGAPGSDTSTQEGIGSIPDGFVAETVVRCVRATDATGTVTVEAVTLNGDVDAVTEAFARPSERSAGDTVISCAYSELPSAGVWLVAPRIRDPSAMAEHRLRTPGRTNHCPERPARDRPHHGEHSRPGDTRVMSGIDRV